MKALVYWALSGIGGIQRFDALLTKALLDLGLETHALIPASMDIKGLEAYHGVSIDGVRIIKYGIVKCKGPYCDLLNNIEGNIVLSNLMNKYDIIFIDTLSIAPAGRQLIKRRNYVCYVHGPITTKKPRPLLTYKPNRLFLHALLNLISDYRLISPERVFTNSLYSAILSKDVLGYTPKVLHPPVDVSRVMKYSSGKEPIISMLARFGSAKGQDFALMVFKELIHKCNINDVKLYLMGSINNVTDIRYIKYLLDLAERMGVKNRIRIFINPSINDVYKILNKSMAFIHVKPHEHFGIVVVEAMAAGAVPIVHKSGGPWLDIISMGKYGYGYSNKEEAVEALCKVLTSNKEFTKMSNLVRERAKEFSYERFRDKISNIINTIIY